MIHAGIAIGVAIAVVLCIAVLVALALIGMRRYGVNLPSYLTNTKACGSGGEDKQEMEWDHSALNITVNPLEAECKYEDDCGLYGEDEPHLGVCMDKNEEQAEASEQEEEEVEKDATRSAIVRELEWDDSTLSM